MAWLQSIYLHDWRVIISYSWSHLQSLLKDHWEDLPKSRGCRNAHNFCCKLRLDITHSTTDWNKQNRRKHNNSWLTALPFDMDNTGCHVPPSQRSDISSKHLKYYRDDYLVFDHYTSFTQMLWLSHICHWQAFPNMFLIPQHLRIFQNIHHHQHGDHRILANGMRIWHLECHYCLTAVLGRRPWPNHPRHSLRTCLHHLLLDTHQPHTMTVIWRSSIWTFCSCT